MTMLEFDVEWSVVGTIHNGAPPWNPYAKEGDMVRVASGRVHRRLATSLEALDEEYQSTLRHLYAPEEVFDTHTVVHTYDVEIREATP